MTTQSPFLPSSPVLIRLEPVRVWLAGLSLGMRCDAMDVAYALFEERRGLMQRLARNRERYRLTILDWASVGRFTYWFELKWDRLVLAQIEIDVPPPTTPSGLGLAAAIVLKTSTGNRIFSARAKPRISAVRTVAQPRVAPSPAALDGTHRIDRVAIPAVETAIEQTAVDATAALTTTVVRQEGWSGRRNPFDIKRVFVADLIQWLIVNHVALSPSGKRSRTAVRTGSATIRAERLALRLAEVIGTASPLSRHRERFIIQAMMMLALNERVTPALSRQKIARLIRSVHAIMPSGWRTKMDLEIGGGGRDAPPLLSQIFSVHADLDRFFFANTRRTRDAVAEVTLDAVVR